MDDTYVTPKEAARYYGVTQMALRVWEQKKKVQVKRTANGHRRYKICAPNSTGRKIIYARVSSNKQEKDLESQVKFMQSKYPDYEVITDIGSGINYKRTGFKSILEYLFERNIYEVVVSSPDRFSRFGASELFKWIFEKFGGKLTFVQDHDSEEEGLTSELMEIITVFSARYYGKRKYSNKADTNISESKTD